MSRTPTENPTEDREPLFLASENPHPVLRVNAQACLIYANPAADSLIASWKLPTTQNLTEPYISIIKKALATDEQQEYELTLDAHTLLLHFVPIRHRDEVDIYGFDITPRKLLQQELVNITQYDPATGLLKPKQSLNEIEARHNLLKELHHSLKEEQILLYYQPQVDLQQETIIGAEALVRWQHPEHGLMTPGHFTQLAEESGFIVPLGNWVLEYALKQLEEWHSKHKRKFTMAVNVSAIQLQNKSFVEHVEKLLNKSQVSPEFLDLEIVESLLIDNTQAEKVLYALAELGVNIVLDDFGTGYSSLSYLSSLPISKIKIDKRFVNTPGKEEKAILDNLLQLGRDLNLTVLAEGIENYTQLSYLLKHGCLYGQGFYFSEPLPAHSLENLL